MAENVKPGDPKTSARRGLAVFGALTFVGTAIVQGTMMSSGKPIEEQGWLIFALMWTPGVASVVTRLVLREGFRDVSFRLPRLASWRVLLVAWLFAAAVGLLAYGSAWLTGLERFSTAGFDSWSLPPALTFGCVLGLTLLVGPFLAMINATGEEIGWRGYMLTRLVDAEVPRPLLVSGLVWGMWHVPLILSGQYAAGPHPALSALMFVISITCGGYIAGYVRLATGSVWPAAFFHGAWNATIQGVFDRFTEGGGASTTTSIWIGESGILVVVASLACMLVVLRKPWDVRLNPLDEPTRTLSLREA